MPYLIFILLVLVSCGKKNNEVSPKATANVFTSKYEELFFSEDGRNREVVLNALLENKLNQKTITAETFYRLNPTLRAYEKQNIEMLNYKEENLAKLYISFEDKVMIYFMPEKVDLNILEGELNLPHIPGNVYSWAKREGDFSKSGDLLILVNTNLNEIIQNDKKFYVEKIELNNQLTGLNVNNGMRIKLKLDTNYLIQKLAPVRKEKNKRATHKNFYRECSEAGTCMCAYTINQPSAMMMNYEVNDIQQVKFQVQVGNKLIDSQNLNLVLTGKNKVETEFDIEEENESSSVYFKNLLTNVQEKSVSYNAAESECANELEVINRRVQPEQRVVIERWGRGNLELGKIKL